MTPTVETSFLWIMVAIAFVAGLIVQRAITRGERIFEREVMRVAFVLIAELSALARAGGRPLPIAIHRRIVNLRDRAGA